MWRSISQSSPLVELEKVSLGDILEYDGVLGEVTDIEIFKSNCEVHFYFKRAGDYQTVLIIKRLE
ncbi:hypothetical protein EZ449_06215 [Pedobacter frigidisoli]|uniref:DUF4926 domain-containing protein n=1 Tax=Pedobacter frigidisoli TaxID=2530455 RepID=A0A4R0P5K0_9SPHI|nr:hypothetical protein [Pedobacter frigidisoli]TCD11086.1 hypothetical protein EZ449_06215 [Pedobacter frigidisoli]